jgi:hypothetical protein
MTRLQSGLVCLSAVLVACVTGGEPKKGNGRQESGDMAVGGEPGDMAVGGEPGDMAVGGAGHDDLGATGGAGGGGDLAVGGGASLFGGVTFPWPVFDGTVPDTPVSTTGKTWYVDAKSGSDAAAGATLATAYKTLGKALSVARAGDTILMAGGIYRERPDFGSSSGAPGKPITIGSYGRGTGRPILDGGVKPAAWTKVRGTVWKTSTAGLAKFTNSPVLGIYVNDGTNEYALKEVAHGQLASYGSDPLPSGQTQADVTDFSNKWYYDRAAKVLYADFGGTLGTGDPNGADISLLYNSDAIGHEPLIVLDQGHGYFSFVGLTMRAASWHAVYSESSGNSFDRCDMKFNGGGGAFFSAASNDLNVGGNRVTNTRIWMTVLENWPRFNNGNTSGGWPGALVFYAQSNSLAQGNVIYQNGGEGMIFYGTPSSGGTTHVSTNNRARNNVIFDNFSVNLYFDNTQNATAEQNFVFNHPRDPMTTFDNLLSMSNGYNTDWGKRLTPVNVSLADEPYSADDGHAHLSNITVINNIIAGGKSGLLDYDDGTTSPVHGLKNCLIANNTIVLGNQAIPGQSAYGWRHTSSPDASTNSVVQNNLIVTTASSDRFVEALVSSGAGINNDYNFYSGPGVFLSSEKTASFAAWRSGHAAWDQHSAVGEALLTAAAEFSQTAAQKLIYDWSKAAPLAGSPVFGKGTTQSFTTDFTGAARSGPFDIGAIARH